MFVEDFLVMSKPLVCADRKPRFFQKENSVETSMNGGHELPLNVTDVFKHHDLFPLKFYEGYLLRINEVYQKAGKSLSSYT